MMKASTPPVKFRFTRRLRDLSLLAGAMLFLFWYMKAEGARLTAYRLSPNMLAAEDSTGQRFPDDAFPDEKPVRGKKKTVAKTAPVKTLHKPRRHYDWKHPRNKGGPIHIFKTRFLLFQPASPELLQARLQIFRAFVLPAMRQQTSQNFFWIVSVEPDIPANLLEELRQMLDPYPHFYLTKVTLDQKPEGGKDVIRKLDEDNLLTGDAHLLLLDTMIAYEDVSVLETRIDADDALNIDFVQALQASAQTIFKDKGRDWVYWCIHKAMHWQWQGPSAPRDLQAYGAFLTNGLDEDVCAIPALTVGFRKGGQTDTLYRTRAILLQKELTEKKLECGSKTKGASCVNVWNDLEYPVLRIETPAMAVTEKPNKMGRSEAPSIIPKGWEQATKLFATEQILVKELSRLVRQIPPYYMNPPRVDRFRDDEISDEITDINSADLLAVHNRTARPKSYARKRKVFHIFKTRFMQQQPNLVELGKARLELFKAFCLPSMVHQTNQNFFWLIYTDPSLDKGLLGAMVKLLKPYPHFFLVPSLDDKRGLGGKDILHGIKPEVFHTGNTTKLYKYLRNVHYMVTLESRLDADDSLNINYIAEVQRRARERLLEDKGGRDWMFWCINRGMEWNFVGPGSRKPLQTYGALVEARDFEERNFCHTPGLTLGVRRGTYTRTVARAPHHLLFEKLEKEQMNCGGNYTGAECLHFVNNFTFSGLRSRTPTSASMSSVNTNGGKAYRLAAEEGVERWTYAIKTFALLPENTKRVNDYFFENMKTILEENLEGQCTTGHSCRDEAKSGLTKMIQMYSLPDIELNETQK
jgi:hypothetical protein